MTWRRGEAGSTLIDRPKDAPVPDFTNGKERVILQCNYSTTRITWSGYEYMHSYENPRLSEAVVLHACSVPKNPNVESMF